ncbi:hypothetical protein PTTG_11186, partial [Puccinia triticina 1-1 BBBD Race 1]
MRGGLRYPMTLHVEPRCRGGLHTSLFVAVKPATPRPQPSRTPCPPRPGSEILANRGPSSSASRPTSPAAVDEATNIDPPSLANWVYSSKLTTLYLDVLTEIASPGTTFEHKNASLTGVCKASIGVEILKGLLSGGAHVIVTTSRYSRATVEYYQAIYQEAGSRGSRLTVLPFNQGSKQDVEDKGLAMDLDYILPFAAIPENGREINGLDDRSELAHRVMLTNLLRLMGEVKKKKHALKLVTRPTQVVLPLSPNHGNFGN